HPVEAASAAAEGGIRFLGTVRRRAGARGNPAVPACPVSRAAATAMIVNQWVPAAHKGDAIGDSARRVRDLLRTMGHESEIYALTIDDDMLQEARAFTDAAAKSGEI